MRCHFTLTRMVIIRKRQMKNKCWQRCGETGTPIRCRGECKMMQSFWRRTWRFCTSLSYDTAIPLLGIYSREMRMYAHTKTRKWIFTVILFMCSSQKSISNQISIDRSMDKQNVALPYCGILFSIKKEWTTDTRFSMDEPWRHYAVWKNPVREDHVLDESMKCFEKVNLERQKVDWLPGVGGVGRRWEVTINE